MRKTLTITRVVAVTIFLLVCAASSAAFAQKGTVLRVVVVKTDNPAAYVQEIEKGRQITEEPGNTGEQPESGRPDSPGPGAGAIVLQHRVSQLRRPCRRLQKDQRQPRIPGLAEGPGENKKDRLRQPLHRMVAGENEECRSTTPKGAPS